MSSLMQCCLQTKYSKEMDQGCIFPFLKKVDLRITKNYRNITLSTIAVKVYNAPIVNRIKPDIEKIPRKNQNGFRKNQSTTSQILVICLNIGVRTKTFEATLTFVDFSKALYSIYSEKMEWIFEAYCFLKETATALMMLYKTQKQRITHRIFRHCHWSLAMR